MQAMDSMDNDDESLNIGARSCRYLTPPLPTCVMLYHDFVPFVYVHYFMSLLFFTTVSMDEFMRASNMVESNLEKLSARLERSLAVSKEEIVARLPDSPMRSISTSRVTGKAELTKKVSVSTMEHVWSVRARAEAENGEGSPQINIDDLIDENVDEMISAPRSSNRFEAEGGDLEEAKKLIKDLEEELRVTKLALSETKESKMEIERKNISLENAVKELEEAVGSSDSGILKKYNAQTAELQSVIQYIYSQFVLHMFSVLLFTGTLID